MNQDNTNGAYWSFRVTDLSSQRMPTSLSAVKLNLWHVFCISTNFFGWNPEVIEVKKLIKQRGNGKQHHVETRVRYQEERKRRAAQNRANILCFFMVTWVWRYKLNKNMDLNMLSVVSDKTVVLVFSKYLPEIKWGHHFPSEKYLNLFSSECQRALSAAQNSRIRAADFSKHLHTVDQINLKHIWHEALGGYLP